MILTYKVKHNKDFTTELRKAKKIAKFAIHNRDKLSSANVKHIGLKSTISNQILRKYGRDKKAKKVSSVNLIVPNQGVNVIDNHLIIPSLKLELDLPITDFTKVNQIEINKEYAFISVTVPEETPITPQSYLGIDLNATGHIAVMGNPETGKVEKMGKEARHIHNKYKHIRKTLQKQGKYGLVKKIKHRESNKIKDINHKISKHIVEVAKKNKQGIKLEAIKGIRKSRRHSRSFNHTLNSWSFYQLGKFIEYKAKLNGVTVTYIEPAYTSQNCSICGYLGNRNGKCFECSHCGHVDHADSNASFNIATRQTSIGQLNVDRDAFKGYTDTPKEALT
jgi:putative transposase